MKTGEETMRENGDTTAPFNQNGYTINIPRPGSPQKWKQNWRKPIRWEPRKYRAVRRVFFLARGS